MKKKIPGTKNIMIGPNKKKQKNLVTGKKVGEFVSSNIMCGPQSQTKCFTSQGEVFFHKNLTKKSENKLGNIKVLFVYLYRTIKTNRYEHILW